MQAYRRSCTGVEKEIMPTGFEHDQYIAQVALVKAINRLAKAIEESNSIKANTPTMIQDED